MRGPWCESRKGDNRVNLRVSRYFVGKWRGCLLSGTSYTSLLPSTIDGSSLGCRTRVSGRERTFTLEFFVSETRRNPLWPLRSLIKSGINTSWLYNTCDTKHHPYPVTCFVCSEDERTSDIRSNPHLPLSIMCLFICSFIVHHSSRHAC